MSRLSLLLIAVSLAACSASRGPAPIVSRTGDANRPAEPPREAAAPVTPAPAAVTPPPPDTGAVQTTPVRPSGIESRPLDPRAATPGAPGAAGTPGAASGTTGLGGLRTGPKGLKRPYTDAVLAELKTADAASQPAPLKPEAGRTDVATAKPGETDKAAADKAAADKAAAAPVIDLAWPTRGKVLQAYSEPKQVGIILDGKLGDPVGAAADGKVIFSGPGPRGYGNLVIVKHDVDTVTVYAHNKSLLVKEGQSVKRGQKIAEVGDSGADKVGLHFEVRKQGKPVDPQKLLPKR